MSVVCIDFIFTFLPWGWLAIRNRPTIHTHQFNIFYQDSVVAEVTILNGRQFTPKVCAGISRETEVTTTLWLQIFGSNA